MKKNDLIRCLVLITIILSASFLTAEIGEWEGYTSIYQVKDVYEDGNHLWIATLGGLVQYDKQTGERTVYTTANSGLTSNFITAIDKDSAGNLWIGTDLYFNDYGMSPAYFGGVHVWDTEENWTVYQEINSPLPSNTITDIAVDSADNVWIATYFNGVVKLTPDGEWTNYNPDNSAMNSHHVTALHITPEDHVWVALDEYYVFHGDGTIETVGGGTASYINGVWTDYFEDLSMDYNSVRFWDIDADSQGNIWFAGTYDGYYFYDGISFTRYESPFDPIDLASDRNYSSSASTELLDRSKRQASFSREHLLKDIKPGLFENKHQESNYLKSEGRSGSVQSVSIDAEDNLWLGVSRGAAMYDGEEWSLYDQHNTPIGEYHINNVYPLSDQTILIASSFYGLFQYDDGNIIELDISDPDSGLEFMHIWDVNADHSTSVWIANGFNILNNGTGGLSEFDGTSWTNYSYPEIETFLVNDIEIVNDTVYLATGNFYDQGGALYYDGIDWTILNYYTSGLQQPYADNIAIDSQNNIWIGRYDTAYGGVAYYDGEAWTHYNNTNSALISNEIITIAVDPLTDELWVGTPIGLFKYDGFDWHHFHPGNTAALLTGEIWNLYFDDDNTLWIGNLLGLASYDGEEFISHNHKLPALSDGYAAAVVSSVMDEYGRTWHGTIGGIVLFGSDEEEVYDGSNSPLPSNWTLHISSDREGRMWVGTAATGLYTFTYEGETTYVDNDLPVNQGLKLAQNYPNPFNPRTTISFSMNDRDVVSLEIFNIKGQRVTTLIDRQIMENGKHSVDWNGKDQNDRSVGSGVYFYRLSTSDQNQTKRMLMVK